MVGKCIRWAAILAIGLQVAGCYTEYGPIAAEPEPVGVPTEVANVLQSGDVLKVTIYGEEALTGSYTINPAGDIAMPLIGTVRAAGLTRIAVEHEITRRYINGNLSYRSPK